MRQTNNKVQWKTRNIYVDIDTGEKIEKEKLNNYIIIKKDKYASVQNGFGTIEYTNQCQKIYETDLFTTK